MLAMFDKKVYFFFVFCFVLGCKSRRGGPPYITDGDARRNVQKQPRKVTILGVAPANYIP